MVSPEKPRLMYAKPGQIKVPDVRVTSTWEPELLAMFKESVKAMGIVEPVVVVQEKEDLWLVDGLHRLEEAQLNNAPRIQVVAIPGSLKDVYLKNLMLNRLRGKTKVSEMVRVVKHLETQFKMDMEAIAKETGLKRDYVEKMMVIGRVREEVLQYLDADKIGVGHAYEIGRIEDPDVQMRLLLQTKQYDMTVGDLHDVVDGTIKIIAERKASGSTTPTTAPLPPATIDCMLCEMQRPIKDVHGFNICKFCYVIAYEAVKKAKAAQAPQSPEPERIHLE